MATFAVVGLISVLPTLTLHRWRRAAASFMAPEVEVNRVRRYVIAEAHLIAILLLFAVLMARGAGA